MHILILGAGYAGLHAAIELDNLLRNQTDLAQITLVDQNPYHQIVQLLHLTATAAIQTDAAIVPLNKIMQQRAVQIRQGRATQIRPLQRQVVLQDGQALDYDRLLIALGAETNYGGVPGAREHSFPLRTFDEALRLRNHIVARFAAAAKTADPAEQRTLLTFALVGGGYTGCQLAGELAAWAPDLCKEFNVPRQEVRIALLDRSTFLLKQFGTWATRNAERILDRRGVSIYLDTPVERVEPGELYISGDRVLRAGTIIWAGGIRAPALLAESGLPVDASGRVFVDRYLRVRDQALIFAAGDCAHVPDLGDGPVPSTASYAMRQGTHLADTLLSEIEGIAPRTYEPLKLGEVVSLGPGEAIGDPLGVPVFGKTAELMKKGIEVWYRSTLE
jgi:NADH dehydrogenase